MSSPQLRRLVRHGHGFHPVGAWKQEDLAKLTTGMASAGRDVEDLERVGGARAAFADDASCAELGQAMEPIREQIEAGFTTFCVKPSQFIDDARELPEFCRDVVRRAEAMSR